MRLTPFEIDNIKTCVTAIDPDARVFLFGSRTDDQKKGGDIDLFILSRKMNFSSKIDLKARLFLKMDEQKIDVVIKKDLNDPFIGAILKESIEL